MNYSASRAFHLGWFIPQVLQSKSANWQELNRKFCWIKPKVWWWNSQVWLDKSASFRPCAVLVPTWFRGLYDVPWPKESVFRGATHVTKFLSCISWHRDCIIQKMYLHNINHQNYSFVKCLWNIQSVIFST